MRWTAVSIIGLVAGQFEEASLLQTSSRDRALASRAHNSAKVEEEDELDDALGGKSCTTWLADEAVANAHDEIEVFRTQMAAHGYQRAVKKSVKIGAYCPAIIADTTLTFLDTPCEDRNQVLQECTKGLKETCKFSKEAMKKMMNFIKQEFHKAINALPLPGAQKNLVRSNWHKANDHLLEDAINFVDCNKYNIDTNDLTADSFEELQTEFEDGLKALEVAQASQMSLIQQHKLHTSSLASRAHNIAEVQELDELDDALGGKSCTTWLADEAVANAHDEIEVFRTQMAAHGYQRAVKKSVKIGAYCPAIIADTTLTFLDTPCEDRNQVLQECTKGLKETCKFSKEAMKKMMNFIKQEFHKAINALPLPGAQKNLVRSNWHKANDHLLEDAINFVDCNKYNIDTNDLTADSFEELQTEFEDGLKALEVAQASQMSLIQQHQ